LWHLLCPPSFDAVTGWQPQLQARPDFAEVAAATQLTFTTRAVIAVDGDRSLC
jgi:hypothetical protein